MIPSLLVALGLLGTAGAPQPLARAPVAPARYAAAQGSEDSALMAVARRATQLWLRHDFTAFVGTGEAVMVNLPGAEPSAPLRPAQAVALLRDYTEGKREVDVTILVARRVDPDRAYVEAQRVFESEGTGVRHSETLYFGFRLSRGRYSLVEVRALP